ncbi:MAG: hypothetical protein U0572_07480 [Phycisphaerales bacterium]
MRLTSVVATLVACVVFVCRPASAQGTSDLFPEPMNSAEAEAIIDRIGLQDDAKIAALKAFESYIERFLALRKGDIDDYLNSRAALGATTTREDVAGRVDRRRSILKKIAGIENEYFDQVTAIAGTTNAARVTRERDRAARRRDWSASNPFMGRNGRLELADLANEAVGDSKLSDEAQKSVDAAVRSYESQATALIHKLVDLAVEEPLALYDARTAANLKQPQAAEGDAPATAWRDYFEASQKVRVAARQPQMEVRGKLRDATRSQAKAIAKALPAEASSKFMQSFLERAYAAIARPRDPVPGLLKEAKTKLEKGEITAEELAAVEAIAASHAARRAELNEKLMGAIDKQAMSETESDFFMVSGLPGETSEKTDVEKLSDERSKLDDATVASIGGAAAALAKKDDDSAPRNRGEVVINGMTLELPDDIATEGGGVFVMSTTGDVGGDLGGNAVVTMGFASDGMSTGVPIPMSREDIDGIKQQFTLAGDEATILDLLFEDYQSKWKELDQGELAELKSLPLNGPGRFPGSPDYRPPTDGDVARSFELRRVVLEKALGIEREFADSVAAAIAAKVSKDDATYLRHWRERAAYLNAAEGQSGISLMSSGGSKASSLDLVSIVRRSGLPAEAVASTKPALEAWDASSLDALRNRFEVRLAAQRMRAELDRKLEAQAASEGRPGEIRVTSEDEEFRKVAAAEARANETDEVVAKLNKQSLEAALAALPDDASRATLREAWNRKAWPSIYRDRRDVEPMIAKAYALPDLASEAKKQLDAIMSEHRAEYVRLCHEMIEASEKSVVDTNRPEPGNVDFRALQARQDTLNRLRFERNELNAKTLRRAKEVLTPDQAAKIGDLPKEQKAIRFGGPGV